MCSARGFLETKLTDHDRVAETLPSEVLEKMHAVPKSDQHQIISPDKLIEYDAFLLGIPTRFGNMPAQWKAFWDGTSGLWRTAGLWGKYAGLFVSTGTLGGGQESTALAMMSTFAHHGINFVPLGYKNTIQLLGDVSEAHGGSAWGAGTLVSHYNIWIFGI